MDEIIEIKQLKEIKEHENMTFEQMAGEVGVSTLTIKYWLHGVFKPSLLAMEPVRRFIKKHEIKTK